MKTRALVHVNLVMQDHLIPDAVLLMENGLIGDFGEARRMRIPEGAEIIDGGGIYVGPGLIDIHTHAGGGSFFFQDPAAAAAHVLKHGVTSVLPTLYFNVGLQGWLDAIALIDRTVAAGACPNVRGYYLEGPYLNPKFGADRANNPWAGPIQPGDYRQILSRVTRTAKIWAVAPERSGVADFVREVKAAVPGIVFSVAHSEAAPDQIEALIPFGLHLATHHTNATGDRPKYPECRGVCVDETVNFHDDIYAELICDSRGIHVDPYMLRLVEKIKGKDRLILISDAFVIDGPVPPGYEGVTDINFDFAGEIAGSKLTLDVACRNMMVHTGCSLVDAFRYASANPARLLGWTDRGVIRRGARADLVLVDAWMNVQAVILDGNVAA